MLGNNVEQKETKMRNKRTRVKRNPACYTFTQKRILLFANIVAEQWLQSQRICIRNGFPVWKLSEASQHKIQSLIGHAIPFNAFDGDNGFHAHLKIRKLAVEIMWGRLMRDKKAYSDILKAFEVLNSQ